MRSPIHSLVTVCAGALLALAYSSAAVQQPAISFVPVPPVKAFRDATTKDALRYACAGSREDLAALFQREQLPYVPGLVSAKKEKFCHIYYEPTIRGYRAHTESHRVRGLVFTVDSRSFIAQRSLNVGDSLDVAKAILGTINRPLDVSIRSKAEVSDKWRREALLNLFPNSTHTIQLRDNPAEEQNVWAQDYVKSGEIAGAPEVLITRKAYEGKGSNGDLFDLLLASFEERGWTRSKLSWDGGDLQFSVDPRDPKRTILFYGDAARHYWAKSLTVPEYEYVLKLEFGADEAIDLSGLAAHIDYFVSILPDAKTLLVSRYMRGNLELSQGAIQLLISRFGPQPVLTELERIYARREDAFGKARFRVLQLLDQIREEHAGWDPMVDAAVFGRASRYWQENCSKVESQCTSGAGIEKMMERDPGLVRDWVGVATLVRSSALLPNAMVALLYSQLEPTGQKRVARVEAKIRELKALGFDIVEVPQITGDIEAGVPWAGISYVNSVVIDNYIFVPAFALGEAEKAIFQKLERDIPDPFVVVPVYARYALVGNGGVHCVVGFLRSPGLPEIESRRSTSPVADPTALPSAAGTGAKPAATPLAPNGASSVASAPSHRDE